MELELVYNEETQEWEQKPEPFITIECETEEDFEFIGTAVAFYKNHLQKQDKPQTNADRIRSMSDEELAKWLARTQYANMMEAAEIFGAQLPFEEETLKGSEQECLQWLKQPAEE